MADPFLSEIRIFSFNFPPRSWALCNGQLMPINQNQALFSLLGTTYGGNGQTTFALPNLQARVPVHFGGGVTLGESAGQFSHTLTQSELPQHTHLLQADTATAPATTVGSVPLNKLFGQPQEALQGGSTAPVSRYGPANNLVTLNPGAVSNVGGSQAHQNMMPYLTLNFCIALQGIFPSQN